MSTLFELEAAAEALSVEQKAELFRFLAVRFRSPEVSLPSARVVREGDDVLLEAPPGAPAMTSETVKLLLRD